MVTVAKLIKDTALNSIDKQSDPKLAKFVEEHHRKLQDTVRDIVVMHYLCHEFLIPSGCK
jgi:hypothetical protein